MKLYTYWRSSAAYRVRIALELKGVVVEQIPIHLVHDGGAQHSPAYRAIHPGGTVPALVLDDGTELSIRGGIIRFRLNTPGAPPGPAYRLFVAGGGMQPVQAVE